MLLCSVEFMREILKALLIFLVPDDSHLLSSATICDTVKNLAWFIQKSLSSL